MMTLSQIQAVLKVPKNQTNKFGGYRYRSCEDIVEEAKPLLREAGMSLLLSDKIISVGDRIYVEATATLLHDDGKVVAETTASAREPQIKKGMDEAQITGATSSYARKYALNGLFAIDDTKDADAQEPRGEPYTGSKRPAQPRPAQPEYNATEPGRRTPPPRQDAQDTEEQTDPIIKRLYDAPDLVSLKFQWDLLGKDQKRQSEYLQAKETRKAQLERKR